MSEQAPSSSGLVLATVADAIAGGIADAEGRPLHPALLAEVVGAEAWRLTQFGGFPPAVRKQMEALPTAEVPLAIQLMRRMALSAPTSPTLSALLDAFAARLHTPQDLQVTVQFLQRLVLACEMKS